MRTAILITDLDWLGHLSHGVSPIVNFWTPTPWGLKALEPGDQVLFLAKSPVRKVAEYGQYARYEEMSVHDAWEKYGEANGVLSEEEFLKAAGH